MKYCEKCGNQLTENDIFCSKCGAKVMQENKSIFCTNCGKENSQEDKFCMCCGTSVTPISPQEQQEKVSQNNTYVKNLPSAVEKRKISTYKLFGNLINISKIIEFAAFIITIILLINHIMVSVYYSNGSNTYISIIGSIIYFGISVFSLVMFFIFKRRRNLYLKSKTTIEVFQKIFRKKVSLIVYSIIIVSFVIISNLILLIFNKIIYNITVQPLSFHIFILLTLITLLPIILNLVLYIIASKNLDKIIATQNENKKNFFRKHYTGISYAVIAILAVNIFMISTLSFYNPINMLKRSELISYTTNEGTYATVQDIVDKLDNCRITISDTSEFDYSIDITGTPKNSSKEITDIEISFLLQKGKPFFKMSKVSETTREIFSGLFVNDERNIIVKSCSYEYKGQTYFSGGEYLQSQYSNVFNTKDMFNDICITILRITE